MCHAAHIDDSQNLSETQRVECDRGVGVECRAVLGHHLAARDVISSGRQNAFVIKQRNAPKSSASGSKSNG